MSSIAYGIAKSDLVVAQAEIRLMVSTTGNCELRQRCSTVDTLPSHLRTSITPDYKVELVRLWFDNAGGSISMHFLPVLQLIIQIQS